MNFVEVTVGDGGKRSPRRRPRPRRHRTGAARARGAIAAARSSWACGPSIWRWARAPPGRSFDAVVEVVEQLGSEILLEARLGATRITVARVPAETPVAAGDKVRAVGAAGPAAFLRCRDGDRDRGLTFGAVLAASDPMTTDLEAAAAERGIKYFLVSFTDLMGVQRAKLVPAAAIDGMARTRRRLRGLRDLARHDAGRSGHVRDARSRAA